MIDFNSSSSLSGQVAVLVDAGMQQARARQSERQYLGASRLGAACERALQFEYAKAPVDHGRDIPGRMLRIFERGHVIEDCMVAWLRDAGFDLRTRKPDGEQFGFSVADGRLQGHVDGVIVAGPEGFAYPALWECKCLGNKSWSDLDKKGLAVSKPIYAAQVAIYQAYLELHEHPAIFTAINADTMEIYTERVPFDAALAQRMSDRAVSAGCARGKTAAGGQPNETFVLTASLGGTDGGCAHRRPRAKPSAVLLHQASVSCLEAHSALPGRPDGAFPDVGAHRMGGSTGRRS